MIRARVIARMAPALFVTALSGCGLQPLYGDASHGATMQTLGQVDVAPIEGKAGWMMRNALSDRLHSAGRSGSRYQLKVQLDDNITGFGVHLDEAVARERRTLRARYQLVDAAKGTVLLDATAGSDAGIDVVSSDYATIAAENTALENLTAAVADQIVTRLAIYARNRPAE